MEIIRTPYAVVHREESGYKDVYGGAGGMVFVECMAIVPKDSPSKRAIVFTHPIGGGAFLPLVTALAAAGHHVLYVNPRYRGNDSALIMEKCVADLGAALRHAREKLGYEEIILGGWSGGGSMSLFYQDQAQHPTITHTPAGDAYDLTALAAAGGLPPVQGIMLLAAHISRAMTLTEWMDPSILDEAKPFDRDPELNIYDPANPNQPPYSEAFVERFRAAQIARNRRITAWAKAQLASIGPNEERAFVVHGTMADVRWTDPSQDPSDRRPYECYLGVPKIANDGPVGLARFTTLRSWLSQWSYDDTNATGLGNATRSSCPVLVINNTADLACTPSHARRLFDAVGHADKEYADVAGADHYYIERPDLLPVAVGLCSDWLARKFG
jgi:pimeloyl-ACP methyl ester carboxylesterase